METVWPFLFALTPANVSFFL
jgi:lanosterol synthase